MTPKDAEFKYGKDIARKIWNKLSRSPNTPFYDGPEGVEVPEAYWDRINRGILNG